MNYIFLPGIFKEMFSTMNEFDIYDNLDSSEDIPIDNNYVSVPKFYYGKDSWPSQTNLLCWYCSSKFTTKPWFVPLNLTKIVKNGEEVDVIETLGVFCYPTCAMSFIGKDNKLINNKWTSERLL